MNNIVTIARSVIKTAVRSRVIIILMILFLGSSLISLYVGSSTVRTEMAAYDMAAQMQNGTSGLPPRPALSAMTVMRNSIDYVLMIGALLAIFLGFDSLSRDYQDRTMHIILTRSIYRDQYLSGKIAGGLGLIILLHLAAFVIEMGGLGWIGSEAFGLKQAGTLLVFHLAATVYMLLFYLAALFFSGLFLRSLPAFLASVTVWLGTSYVLPEMAKSLKTFLMVGDASLQTVQSTAVSTPLSSAIEILSPAYHFRTFGTWLFSGTGGGSLPTGSLIFLPVVTIVPALALFLMFNSREVGAHE